MTKNQLTNAAAKQFGPANILEVRAHKDCVVIREQRGAVLYACSGMSGRPRFYEIAINNEA